MKIKPFLKGTQKECYIAKDFNSQNLTLDDAFSLYLMINNLEWQMRLISCNKHKDGSNF